MLPLPSLFCFLIIVNCYNKHVLKISSVKTYSPNVFKVTYRDLGFGGQLKLTKPWFIVGETESQRDITYSVQSARHLPLSSGLLLLHSAGQTTPWS